MKCYNCGSGYDGEVHRTTLCPTCGKELKVCLNCSFYSPGAQWDCRETIPEGVREKYRSNFCDYFKKNNETAGKNDFEEKKKKNRSDFDALFG